MSAPQPARLASLDQFRGYTVAGMFLVNFLGDFDLTPAVLKHHHTYFSYADSIMPQFLFAVGFAFRLTFLRRYESDGPRAAYGRAARRIVGLMLVALVVHAGVSAARSWSELARLGAWGAVYDSFKRNWFQTLMHIAVTSLWVLPVVRANAAVRVLFMVGSAAAHVLLSAWFNFEWVYVPPTCIDGGPLGFLTWTVPLVVGTLACDAVDVAARQAAVGKMLCWGAALMLAGYALSCGTRAYDRLPSTGAAPLRERAEHPVFPTPEQLRLRPAGGWLAEPPLVRPPGPSRRALNYWMMSQRAGTLSYLVFSAGFSLALYALFYVACDRWGWQWGVFRTFGTNALAGYVLHDLVGAAVRPFLPPDSPGWYLALGTTVFFLVTYGFLRYLEANRIFLRL